MNTSQINGYIHPAANRQAERYVHTVKQSIRAMGNEGGDIHVKLANSLTEMF